MHLSWVLKILSYDSNIENTGVDYMLQSTLLFLVLLFNSSRTTTTIKCWWSYQWQPNTAKQRLLSFLHESLTLCLSMSDCDEVQRLFLQLVIFPSEVRPWAEGRLHPDVCWGKSCVFAFLTFWPALHMVRWRCSLVLQTSYWPSCCQNQ